MKNLNIIFESENYLVIDKPAGLVVHEGAGETGETLVDLVEQKYPEIKKYSWPDSIRPGIIHRLDKDTSGLIIVAKNPETQKYFQKLFSEHKIIKKYYTLVLGKFAPDEGTIVSQISRDPHNRLKQKATYLNLNPALGKSAKSRLAETEYKTIQNYKYQEYDLTLLDVSLKTGRMHQIRVHMLLKTHPVIGDQVYNTKKSKKISDLLGAKRQFLHSYYLNFVDPDGKNMDFQIKLLDRYNIIITSRKGESMNIILMVGGGGTRLWPMSRNNTPKQFNALISDLSMFEETFNRFKNAFPLKNIYVSANTPTAKLAKKLVPEIPDDHYIIEPEKRDTGPAMAFAAAYLFIKSNPDEPMVYIPADHYIKDVNNYIQCFKEAEKTILKTNKMIDIAIVTTFPNVSLGYTKIGKLVKNINGIKFYEFKGQVEKPDIKNATKFHKSKNYLWHANYFMWTPKMLLKAYEKYAPEIFKPIENIIKALKRNDKKTIEKEFSKTEKISIDYAVAERMNPKDVFIIKGEFGWSDIGSWEMLYDQMKSDTDSNRNLIKANLINLDTKNCLVYGPKEKLIATLGVSNLAIVDTKDALLICKREDSQKVKKNGRFN